MTTTHEGVKKFDCSFADFDAYMNDLDMEIESRFGPIGLGRELPP